jgi:hypothetical protein
MDSMLQWKKPGKRREMPEIRYFIIFASPNPVHKMSKESETQNLKKGVERKGVKKLFY